MRILLVMDPGILVPPVGYGGIERIIALLAEEYSALGHTVDILATEGSYVAGCTMHSIGKEGFPPEKKEMNKAIFRAWKFLWKNRKKYDLIHNFGRLLYLLPVLNSRVNKIMSYQREITVRNISVFTKLPNKNLFFTGCSANLVQRAGAPGKWTPVHNALDFSQFTLTENLPSDAPLIFLGRIEKIKGCHIAIAAAKATGNKLIIAGNISKLPEEKKYYEEEIKPLIDGEQIMFVGEVNDEQKNKWLGMSRAFLMPILWNEPFGIVMIEAMACGTPVIAFEKGSVPEVVDEGITGLICNTQEQMIEKIRLAENMPREKIREVAFRRFSGNKIAEEYLSIIK